MLCTAPMVTRAFSILNATILVNYYFIKNSTVGVAKIEGINKLYE